MSLAVSAMASVTTVAKPQRTQWEMILTRLKRNRLSALGIAIVLLYSLLAALAPLIAPADPTAQNLDEALKGVSTNHWMGQDEFGRDVFSRVLYGARLSMVIGALSVLLGFSVGISLGTIAAFYGLWIDAVIMRLMDILLALPGILLAIAIIAALGVGMENVIFAVGIYTIPQYARLSRSSVLTVKEQVYVEAAKAVGTPSLKIILRHVVPNAIGPLIVYSALRFSTAILTASGLSFLGLGVQPPDPEWGAMLATSRQYLRVAPHLSFMYGSALLFLILGFNMLGEGVRDALDPRTSP